MKASEVYDIVSAQVDELQKQLKNNHRDQLGIALQLEAEQRKMKQLIDITIKSHGDRELSGYEIVQLTNPVHV